MLIDITTAFDSVIRDTFNEVLVKVIESNAEIFLALHKINREMVMNIIGEEVFPTLRMCKGDSFSSFFFLLYIDEGTKHVSIYTGFY